MIIVIPKLYTVAQRSLNYKSPFMYFIDGDYFSLINDAQYPFIIPIVSPLLTPFYPLLATYLHRDFIGTS